MRSSSPAAKSRSVPRAAGSKSAVRIIGGQWKRTPLVVSDAEGLRPTPDRVKESLFNWLLHFHQGSLQGLRALDLFAGTGALGFEAASRGAREVVLVEKNANLCALLIAAKSKLDAGHVEVLNWDALRATEGLFESERRFDLIFLDPPFYAEWLMRAIPSCLPLLADEGLLYLESEYAIDSKLASTWGLELLRADKAGQVFYHLLRRKIGNIPGESSPC
ncbi:MAG: 16S rRNA (guanine(966)-N(2))-methyltransferase RsmD [Burkholderiaceae bacterium]|jgi:16S rRNA (guanine(966)-N(2))-methyltransferase RsmD